MNLPLLDLHGFRVEEVFDAVDRFIMDQTRRGKARVRIRPGKGTGAVKKELLDYLKKGRYPWEYEKDANGRKNEGALIVILDD